VRGQGGTGVPVGWGDTIAVFVLLFPAPSSALVSRPVPCPGRVAELLTPPGKSLSSVQTPGEETPAGDPESLALCHCPESWHQRPSGGLGSVSTPGVHLAPLWPLSSWASLYRGDRVRPPNSHQGLMTFAESTLTPNPVQGWKSGTQTLSFSKMPGIVDQGTRGQPFCSVAPGKLL
jgi:hypothetical protein